MKQTIKRGRFTGEEWREVGVDDITIPDLWHIATMFSNAENVWDKIKAAEAEAKPDFPSTTVKIEINGVALAKIRTDILETWHLCYDLLRHIREH